MEWIPTPETECECIWSGAESKPCELHRRAALGKFWTKADYKVVKQRAYNLKRG